MSNDVMASIIDHIISDKKFHARLVELYFLASDKELSDLTWQIAGLPPEKRNLLAELIRMIAPPVDSNASG